MVHYYINQSTSPPRLRIVFVNTNQMIERIERTYCVFVYQLNTPFFEMQFSLLRRTANKKINIIQRLVVSLQLIIRLDAIDDIDGIVGSMHEGLIKIGYCFIPFALSLISKSTSIICHVDERIALDDYIKVGFGTNIIFELYFGNCTKIIGVDKIWFCLDNLIKILNRKHIILKIQRIATNRGQSVGVELRIAHERYA